MSWTWDELVALPRAEVRCDIHCVTRWSRLDNRFEGVPIREIMRRVRPKPEAKRRAHPRRSRLHDESDARRADATTTCCSRSSTTARTSRRTTAARCASWCRKLYFWKSAKWLRALRVPRREPARLLGGQRLPHARRSLEGGALLGPGDARDAADEGGSGAAAAGSRALVSAARGGSLVPRVEALPRAAGEEAPRHVDERGGLIAGHRVTGLRHLDEAAVGQGRDHALASSGDSTSASAPRTMRVGH